MSRTRRLTYEDDARTVKPGDQLYYSAGLNEHHCEAQVTLVSAGFPGCKVHVDQITTKGELSSIEEGKDISAAWSELEITVL